MAAANTSTHRVPRCSLFADQALLRRAPGRGLPSARSTGPRLAHRARHGSASSAPSSDWFLWPSPLALEVPLDPLTATRADRRSTNASPWSLATACRATPSTRCNRARPPRRRTVQFGRATAFSNRRTMQVGRARRAHPLRLWMLVTLDTIRSSLLEEQDDHRESCRYRPTPA